MKPRIDEINEFERNTITHEVDQAMKETSELVAGDVGGGGLVGGGEQSEGQMPKEEMLLEREVLERRRPETRQAHTHNAETRHGRNVGRNSKIQDYPHPVC